MGVPDAQEIYAGIRPVIPAAAPEKEVHLTGVSLIIVDKRSFTEHYRQENGTFPMEYSRLLPGILGKWATGCFSGDFT